MANEIPEENQGDEMNTGKSNMENYLYKTVYNGEYYLVPYHKMGSWYAYMKDLSIFVRDAGNLQIAFHDAFKNYKITQP